MLGIRDILVRIRIPGSEYLWIIDPDPSPDPTSFFIDFKDAKYFVVNWSMWITQGNLERKQGISWFPSGLTQSIPIIRKQSSSQSWPLPFRFGLSICLSVYLSICLPVYLLDQLRITHKIDNEQISTQISLLIFGIFSFTPYLLKNYKIIFLMHVG